MITKAIVESIVDKYRIRVRIPSLDRTTQSSVHTTTDNLNVALVCTLPGVDPNIRPGDVVFVSVDDTEDDEVVILGYLYRTTKTETLCDMLLNELNVSLRATLPQDTHVGNVTPKEIRNLSGVKGNIQHQLDMLTQQVARIQQVLSIPVETGG